MTRIQILCAIFAFLSHSGGQYVGEQVIVQTANGQIKGVTQQTRNGSFYNSFLGIRYAQAPVGELRFQPPKAVEPWDDVFDATYEKGICYQVTLDSDLETEDCLMLNLFTPAVNDPNAKLPVLVFIHGGGFVEGTGILEWGVGPNFFIDYNTIMIAINYRVGPFGFISTGDEVVPGNNGMKDQVLALQWVQRNVQYFGGDPNKVTIFGQSAGAASVSYLLLSPKSVGLYRAAICESGSALSPWAYQRDQINITYMTAGYLNADFKESRNSTALLAFLQSVSATELDQASVNVTKKLSTTGNFQLSKGFYYTPVLEPEHGGAFLTRRMYESFENGEFIRVPTLIGINSEESIFMLNRVLHRTLKEYDNDHKLMVPFDMHIADEAVKQKVGDLIKQNYTPDIAWEYNKPRGINFHSNQDFDKSIIKQAELQAPYVPVYFYEFTYHGEMNNNHRVLNGSTGVAHGDEQNYIFNRWFSQEIPDNTDLSVFPEADVRVHDRFMTLWTNFARELNPTPVQDEVLQNIIWPTVQPGQFRFLEISNDLIIRNEPPKNEMYAFWNELYETYATKPYDTF
ncbi:venom carboxylesterase-6-like [Cylas formicarius]|uniref:venom carboxylesterase-6-like n=1 Tax=Cylas formicarius TaxID=197179 RepID=UPI002958CFB4|nr:venom carboxylesterase-6-like [Cylas formicarius]